jgi:hypothetical protein
MSVEVYYSPLSLLRIIPKACIIEGLLASRIIYEHTYSVHPSLWTARIGLG